MFRLVGALSLSLLSGSAPPADAPTVQRPTVQRPATPPPEPTPTPQPTPPSTPAPTPEPAPPPSTTTPGGPPSLPPASSGATPDAPTPAPTPTPTPAPPPTAPAEAFPPPTTPVEPVNPQPAPVEWETQPAPNANAPVMPGASQPAPAPGVQWENEPAAAQPRPQYVLLRPRNTGLGLYIVGGMMLSAGVGVRIYASTLNQPNVAFAHMTMSPVYNPLIATGLSLHGSGRGAAGRLHAYDDVFDGPAPKRVVMPGLGWGLFAGGVTVWLLTRLPFLGVFDGTSTARATTILEAGYYASLPLSFAGMHLGPYGSAYRNGTRRYRLFQELQAAPMQSSHRLPDGRRVMVSGVSVSGRF